MADSLRQREGGLDVLLPVGLALNLELTNSVGPTLLAQSGSRPGCAAAHAASDLWRLCQSLTVSLLGGVENHHIPIERSAGATTGARG